MLGQTLLRLEQQVPAELPQTAAFRLLLLRHLQERIGPWRTADIALLAIVVDPFVKMFLNNRKLYLDADRQRAVELLKEHVIRLPDPAAPAAGVALPAIAGVAALEKYGLKSDMESLWQECADDGDAGDPVATAHAEVERWVAFKVPGYNFSAGLQSLKWWRDSNVFPRIRAVAQLFMGAPATSASSERVWSTAKRVCGGERSRMTPEHMQSLVRLHENLRRTSSLFKNVAAADSEDDADLCDAEEQKVRDKRQFRMRK